MAATICICISIQFHYTSIRRLLIVKWVVRMGTEQKWLRIVTHGGLQY
jgi:hypothetical protein